MGKILALFLPLVNDIVRSPFFHVPSAFPIENSSVTVQTQNLFPKNNLERRSLSLAIPRCISR